MHPEHLLEFAAQVAGNQVQGLLVHRAPFDRIDGHQLLESTLDPLDQRALPGADRSHQIQHLAALLALERSGMKVADDLRYGPLDAKELIGKKLVDFYRLVLVK